MKVRKEEVLYYLQIVDMEGKAETDKAFICGLFTYGEMGLDTLFLSDKDTSIPSQLEPAVF